MVPMAVLQRFCYWNKQSAPGQLIRRRRLMPIEHVCSSQCSLLRLIRFPRKADATHERWFRDSHSCRRLIASSMHRKAALLVLNSQPFFSSAKIFSACSICRISFFRIDSSSSIGGNSDSMLDLRTCQTSASVPLRGAARKLKISVLRHFGAPANYQSALKKQLKTRQ